MKVRRLIHDTGGAYSLGDVTDRPCPTITAGGDVSNAYHYRVETKEEATVPKIKSDVKKESGGSTKPEYRVPSMDAINALPPNGLNGVSMFSGCGGSSLGCRMAGFKVLWASEFIDAARASYEANKRPHTIVDGRDIREVTAAQILDAIGMVSGQLDFCEASPPCASFSTAGKRQAGWGQAKKYSDKVQRTDDLFWEFARILEGLQPRCFVAENVSGLVKGTAKGYFIEILARLKDCGYRVTCRVLDAQWLGVPQQRQRTIFVGVRDNLVDSAGLPIIPCHPVPLPFRYSVREAIPWIGGLQHDSMGLEGARTFDVTKEPMASVRTPGGGANTRYMVTPVQEVEVSEDTFNQHRVCTDRPAPSIRARKQGHLAVGPKTVVGQGANAGFGKEAFMPTDVPCPTVGTGPNSGNGRCGPGTLKITHVEPEADMTGKATGTEFDRMGAAGTQSDKYFQLVRPDVKKPCPTVTAAGGNAGLASVCHPTERRKFSIAELRRICAFPDDFVLTGSYAQCWERLGRAVPPIMMVMVARVIRDQVLYRADGKKPWQHDLEFVKSLLKFAKESRKK